MENYVNFYPTPENLANKMLEGIDWKHVKTVLEPSAGKGDLLDAAKKSYKTTLYSDYGLKADCIEINPDLRAALKGKDYRVVHDDFLTFETEISYDLIIMNPPFDQGAKHLLKAIRMQEKTGGMIVSLLNAETLKNPYTAERTALVNKLESLGATIEYCQGAFSSAERETEVEVAIVKVQIETRQKESFIFEKLKKARAEKDSFAGNYEETRVAEKDFVSSIVKSYQLEVEAGLKLIEEWEAMVPFIQDQVKGEYSHPIITLKVACEGDQGLRNKNVTAVRRKYWEAIFRNPMFTQAMPSDMCSNYLSKVNELCEYEFSYFNIKEIQLQMIQNMIGGIESSILALFEEMTHEYAWSPEFGNNIHYYNGWATNKAFYVNNKVILPVYGFYRERYFGGKGKEFDPGWEEKRKLRDIEKALDYLAGCPGRTSHLDYALNQAKQTGNTKDIDAHYFKLTFYKKGTMHITFKDAELIKKLNIYAGKHYNMLPPSYGKKSYRDMTPEEKAVVDSFDGGEAEYEQIHAIYEQGYELDLQKSAPLMIAG